MKPVSYSKTALAFGEKIKRQLSTILPLNICAVAGATCVFHIGGRRPERDNSRDENAPSVINADLSVKLATMGAVFGKGSTRSNWSELNSMQSAELLRCFGITLEEFWLHYPKPGHPSLNYSVTLQDVIENLRVGLVTLSAPGWVTKDNFHTLTVDEAKQQIEMRRELIGQMVGSLYPTILENEISDLNGMIRQER